MSVIFTFIARVSDWKALQRLSDQTLIGYARQAGATRYRIFRNTHDAAEVLLLVEFPSHDGLHQMDQSANDQMMTLVGEGMSDERIWEAIDCDGIE